MWCEEFYLVFAKLIFHGKSIFILMSVVDPADVPELPEQYRAGLSKRNDVRNYGTQPEDLEKGTYQTPSGLVIAAMTDRGFLLVHLGKWNQKKRVLSEIDKVDLPAIPEFHLKKPIATTIGRFIRNVAVVFVFDGLFEYDNGVYNIGKYETEYIEPALNAGEITPDQYYKYLNQGSVILNRTEICVPTLSPKSMQTHPGVAKARSSEITNTDRDLNDPVVGNKQLAKLQKLDDEWLEGDVSERFIKPFGGKARAARDKLYLAGGVVPEFSAETGKYSFIKTALVEGIDLKDFPVYANEVRRGSINRGMETQNGGALFKAIIKLAADYIISEHDCKTKRRVTKDIADYDTDFIGVELDNGTVITEDNFKSFVGKEVKMRSPRLCETKDGYCAKCMRLDESFVGKSMVMILGEKFSIYTKLALKAMHHKDVTTVRVDPRNFTM